jgi:hypothetical protein
MRLFAAILVLTALASAASQPEQSTCPTGPPKHISIKEGEYSPTPGTTIRLENFTADIVPLTKEMPECLRNETLVQSGSITLSSDSLTKLFNNKSGGNAKMKDMTITTAGQNLSIAGKVHKVMDINFQIQGPLKPLQHGDVRMDVDTIHADGMPIKGLMKMFGSDLGSLMGSASTPGMQAENNSLIFHTEQLMHFRGEITAVHVLKDGLTLDFGPSKAESHAEVVKPSPAPKHVAQKAQAPPPRKIY